LNNFIVVVRVVSGWVQTFCTGVLHLNKLGGDQ
jgi:hypothetical protein